MLLKFFLFFQDDLILTMERPMNQIFKATSVAIFSFLFSLTVFADNHMEAPQDAALEIYQCNFSDNKDLNDTRKVAAKWDKWAELAVLFRWSMGSPQFVISKFLKNHKILRISLSLHCP